MREKPLHFPFDRGKFRIEKSLAAVHNDHPGVRQIAKMQADGLVKSALHTIPLDRFAEGFRDGKPDFWACL